MSIDTYQRLLDIGWYIALVVFCIAGLALLAHPASAVIQLQQGDVAYLNETVDVTQAASWPAFQVVWCSATNWDCLPPDQIIDLSNGTMEHYWLDPAVFRIGTYYRWDGSWHSAENAMAFRIAPGTRPEYINTTNVTAEPNATVPEPFSEGPFHYLIARGDTPVLYSRMNTSEVCFLWVFGTTDSMYGVPMSFQNNTYSRVLTSSETFALDVSTYSGYIQCNGPNGLQDIFMEDGYLDTPYDDSKIPDVPVLPWNRIAVKEQFDSLVSIIPKFDDILTPVYLEVTEPDITITNVEQDENKLRIEGVTTWDNSTEITLRLDPENYVLPQDVRLHTWQTFPDGSIDAKRKFSTAVTLEPEELAIGPHEIIMNATKGVYRSDMAYTFKITDVYVMPTPTPEKVRLITDNEYNPIPTVQTPVPVTTTIPPNADPRIYMRDTPANSYVIVNEVPEQEPVEPVVSIAPVVPTPIYDPAGLGPAPASELASDPASQVYDPSATYNVNVPLPWWLGILAVLIIWRRK